MSKAPLPMEPRGRLFGFIMERVNMPAYRVVMDLLAGRPGERFLEIGFGTGRLLERIARQVQEVSLAGLDPTPDMVARSLKRRSLRKLGDRLDLRQGTLADAPWPEASFDAAMALHNFQFWSDPEADMAKLFSLVRPGGRVIFMIRDHGATPPDWLPNPISRSGAETEGAVTLLRETGFTEITQPQAKTPSKPLCAVKPG